MARVRVTVPVYGLHGGFPHREHRSKKGRQKRLIGQDKIDTYFVRIKKDERILKKRENMPEALEEPVEFKETLTLDDVLDLPVLPKKKEGEQYPKLRCENCGHYNQLDFWPKDEWARLMGVDCQKCRQPAYYSYYLKNFEANDLRLLLPTAWLRDLIKTGKATLLQLC